MATYQTRQPIMKVGDRRGISMIEVLIVLAILSLLFLLLAPAVHEVMAASWRVRCLGNLRQIGIATMAYEQSHGVVPPAVIWAQEGLLGGKGGAFGLGSVDHSNGGADWPEDHFRAGVFLQLLDYLDQSAAYSSWNVDLPVSAPGNETVRARRIGMLVCPSEPSARVQSPCGLQGGRWARGSYAINGGPSAECLAQPVIIAGLPPLPFDCARLRPGTPHWAGIEIDPPDPMRTIRLWGPGVTGVNRGFGGADFEDGRSSTVLFDELRVGVTGTDRRGTWAMPSVGASITFGFGKYSEAKSGPNSVRPKADTIQDCRQIGHFPRNMPCSDEGASLRATARSNHIGGVHALMLDGSGRFVSNTVSLEFWTAIHGRNDGLPTPLD